MTITNKLDSSDPNRCGHSIKYALEHLTLGLDSDEKPYAVINGQPKSNPIAHPLEGKTIKTWIRKNALNRDDLLKRDDIKEVIETLFAHASANENIMDIHLRVAPSEHGGVVLDLCDKQNKRVLMNGGNVSILDSDSNVLFKRSPTMSALPIPADKGNLKTLIPYLNMSAEHKYLIIAWLTYCLTHPKGVSAYPILIIKGGTGSGKSSLCKFILRPLVDNNSCGVQLFPKDVKDLAISSQNQYVIIMDNIRTLSKQWSDILCMTSTAGSIVSRKLYSDSEESLLHLHAPMVLNGIHNFVVEPDLASRCVTIQLQNISPNKRREESDIAKKLATDMPEIFRGLLDLSAKLLEKEATAKVLHSERMIGFSRWLAAMELVRGIEPGKLQLSYCRNIREAMRNTVEDNYLAIALLNFAANSPAGQWKGTPTELLQNLITITPPAIQNRRNDWPQNPNSMSKRLRSIEKVLETQGVALEFSQSKSRQISIHFTPQEN
jgi:hypothetical protein